MGDMGMSQKNCTVCGELKMMTDFSVLRRARDGRASLCKECDRARGRAYRAANHKKELERSKSYYKSNREAVLVKHAQYRKENGEKRRASGRRYHAAQRAHNPAYLLSKRTRWLVRDCLKGTVSGCFRNLPYTKAELASHLLSTLPDGYTEADIPNLHIDHIRPVSSFNLTGEPDDEFQSCWALSNLRLIPAEDNLSKGAKWLG